MLFQMRSDIDYGVQYLGCVGCVAVFLGRGRGGQTAVQCDSGSLTVHSGAKSKIKLKFYAEANLL